MPARSSHFALGQPASMGALQGSALECMCVLLMVGMLQVNRLPGELERPPRHWAAGAARCGGCLAGRQGALLILLA